MSYKTLLVHLSNEAVVGSVLEVAIKLAEQHVAHLVGLHVIPAPQVYATDIGIPMDVSKHFLKQQAEVEARIRWS